MQNFVTSATLARLLPFFSSSFQPFTFIDYYAGPSKKTALSESTGNHRRWINRMWQQGRVLPGFPIHTFSAWHEQVKAANGFEGTGRELPTHESLKYMPTGVGMALPHLRSHDYAVIVEQDKAAFKQLSSEVSSSRQVKVLNEDPLDLMTRLFPARTNAGLVLLDAGPTISRVEQQTIATLAQQTARHLPFATQLITIPFQGYGELDTLVNAEFMRSIMNTGVRNIFGAYVLQSDQNSDAREVAGAGVIVVNPPEGFDQTMIALMRDIEIAADPYPQLIPREALLLHEADLSVVSDEDRPMFEHAKRNEARYEGIANHYEKLRKDYVIDFTRAEWMTPRSSERTDFAQNENEMDWLFGSDIDESRRVGRLMDKQSLYARAALIASKLREQREAKIAQWEEENKGKKPENYSGKKPKPYKPYVYPGLDYLSPDHIMAARHIIHQASADELKSVWDDFYTKPRPELFADADLRNREDYQNLEAFQIRKDKKGRENHAMETWQSMKLPIHT